MNRIAKIAAVTVGFTMALGVATPAGAQTIEQLQAQINALLAQLAAIQGSSQTTGGYTFTRDLTIGATGADVTALQNWLISKGHAIPAGATGYFGTQTRAALAAYQAANGISPAAGYFGPITRAKVNVAGGVTTPGTTTPGAGITTPGVEGTLTAEVNPTPVNGVKVYEGDSKVGVLGLRLEATLSDVRVERVKVQLPTAAASFYNRAASRMYVMDGSTVVGSVDLNSNTVVREGSNYFVTVSGINYVVPKNTTRVLTVALDMYSSINIGSGTGEVASSQTLTIPVDGIRGVDGAGINLFAPSSSSFSRTISIEQDQALSANLKISLNANSPKAATIVANDGSDEDEADGVELLRFDVRAEKDQVEITDLKVTVSSSSVSGSGATTTTVYLYEGSNLIGSDTVGAAGVVTFSNIDYVIPRDTTRTLSVKVDVASANSTGATFSASVTGNTTNFVAENSMGDTIATVTGSASGETMTFRSVGPEIVLVSKSLTHQAGVGDNGTSTAKATFNFQITAVGGDLYFGPQSASTTFDFQLYKDGSAVAPAAASTTSWTKPSGTVAYATTGFVLSEGQTVTIPVDFVMQGRLTTGAFVDFGSYTLGVDAIHWSSNSGVTDSSSTFMADLLDWRTNSITLP